MIHGLTALWPPASTIPTHFDMLALLAFLLSGFLLLKFMNDDYQKQLEEDKKKKKKNDEEQEKKKLEEEQTTVVDKEADSLLPVEEKSHNDSLLEQLQPGEELLERAEEMVTLLDY